MKNDNKSNFINDNQVPSLSVGRCNDKAVYAAADANTDATTATAVIDHFTGTMAPGFPKATVNVCYTTSTLDLHFVANEEYTYYMNDEYTHHNDPIYEYTVMEAFVAVGPHNPTSYLEFEVNPHNVTWTAYIQNPNGGANPIAAAMIDDLDVYGITASTFINETAKMWTSTVSLPFRMFNIDDPIRHIEWRMNFFRTYFADVGNSSSSGATNPPQQQLFGAWSPNPVQPASFHQTPYFGRVTLLVNKNHNNIGGNVSGASGLLLLVNVASLVAFTVMILCHC